MKAPTAGRCHVRRVAEADYSALERMYLAHEGESLPEGYFPDFEATIRDPSVDYFVAEVDGQVVGGGGVSDYIPRVQAHLTFGIIDPDECRKGYGTSIMLSRLLFVDPGSDGCQIVLEATEWSSEFFTRLGFSWYGHDEDEKGNLFFFGTHSVCPGDDRIFRKILSDGGVTIAFDSNTNTTEDSSLKGNADESNG